MQAIERAESTHLACCIESGLDPMDAGVQQNHLLDWLAALLAQCITLGDRAHAASQHLIRAIQICVAQGSHGGVVSAYGSNALAAWQEQLAKAMLIGALDNPSHMEGVARACGMSCRSFSRAFKATLGMSPQRWRLIHRIEKAKVLMLQSEFSLTAIAYECGFAEQSHFNHTFYKLVGESPSAWRRGQLQASGESLLPGHSTYDDSIAYQCDPCPIGR
jgi:transcriptional regulator GlxA family with amidase domain